MKKILTLTIFMAIALAIASFCIKNQQEQLVDFVYKRDAEGISQIIYDYWHWIFPQKDIKNLKNVLQNILWEKNRAGKLHIKVLRNKERVIGFVTFRIKNTGVDKLGNVCIISIAKDFRQKGYFKKLIVPATNDLFDAGCTSVYFFPHKEAKETHILERLGFEETEKSQSTIEWFKKANISPDNYPRYAVKKEAFKPDAKKINFRLFISLADYSINFCLYFINSITRNWATNNQNKKINF